MYKLLLCVRYLRTRYLAFVCIVSVMLGVATLIVVNSVMSGFSTKLKERLHGILSDVLVETERSDGFEETPAEVMAKLKATKAGPYIEAMAPTVEVFALLQFNVRDRYGRAIPVTKHVRMIGIDPDKPPRPAVTGFDKNAIKSPLDTVYFLSDGRPSVGKLIEPLEILKEVRKHNEVYRMVIHAIAIGDFQKDFLDQLAQQNGGVYVDLGR